MNETIYLINMNENIKILWLYMYLLIEEGKKKKTK